jgi:DNA polymerase-3 subunit gamma/tau
VQARWPEVADALRRAGRKLLAEAVQRLEPVAVTPEGAVRLGYAPAHDTFAAAVEGGRVEVLAAVREALPGATALSVERLPNAPQAGEAPSAAPRRLTAQDVQQQRRDQLARTDPLLEAAIRALDLELLS